MISSNHPGDENRAVFLPGPGGAFRVKISLREKPVLGKANYFVECVYTIAPV